MNHDIPPFDDHASEREWQAQERAMRAERLGLDANRDDARVQRYRLITRALRQPPAEALPADFAQQMAAQVAPHAVSAETPRERRLEATLFTCVIGIFVIAGAATTVLYHLDWLSTLRIALPALDPQAIRWPLAFAGCLGLSWLLGKLKPRGQAHPLA